MLTRFSSLYQPSFILKPGVVCTFDRFEDFVENESVLGSIYLSHELARKAAAKQLKYWAFLTVRFVCPANVAAAFLGSKSRGGQANRATGVTFVLLLTCFHL
jgi:hypothetical protein